MRSGVRLGRSDGRPINFCISRGTLPSEARSTCQALPQVRTESCAFGEPTSRTTADVTQCMSGEADHALTRKRASTRVGSSQIAEVTWKGNAHKYEQGCHPFENQSHGTQKKKKCFFYLNEGYTVTFWQHPLGKEDWKKHL